MAVLTSRKGEGREEKRSQADCTFSQPAGKESRKKKKRKRNLKKRSRGWRGAGEAGAALALQALCQPALQTARCGVRGGNQTAPSKYSCCQASSAGLPNTSSRSLI